MRRNPPRQDTSRLRPRPFNGVEPLPPESPWWDVPNLTVSPHVSSDSPVDYVTKSLAIFGENVRRMHAGEDFLNVVGGNSGY